VPFSRSRLCDKTLCVIIKTFGKFARLFMIKGLRLP